MNDVATIASSGAARTRLEKSKRRRQRPPAGSADSTYQSDILIYRMVVIILGIAMLLAAVGALVEMFLPQNSPPQFLIALGSGALGALGGLLAPSPMGRKS
jgi:hypothetical protein